jgi:hypothetical protein
MNIPSIASFISVIDMLAGILIGSFALARWVGRTGCPGFQFHNFAGYPRLLAGLEPGDVDQTARGK